MALKIIKLNPALKAWRELLEFAELRVGPRWMFRGLGNSGHGLVPKVGRPHAGSPVYDSDRELTIFRNFKRRALTLVPPQIETNLEWLAVAQHHGLPTRLLDWTPNPLVAAFFAAANVASDQKAPARVYAFPVSSKMLIPKDTDPFGIDEVRFFIPPHLNARMIAQRGCFSVHDEPDQDWKPARLEYFDIASEFAQTIRRRLFYLGIDSSSIMTDLDGLCATLAWQFQTKVASGAISF